MKKVAKTKKTAKKSFGWSEWTLVGIIGVAGLAILISLCTLLRDSPAEKADKELKKLADDYYVEYLYPRLLGGRVNEDPTPAMEIYDDAGIPTTYLRQLLHYNNDEKIDSAEVFAAVDCNTNTTGVRYFPYAPYGPEDYTVTYIWQCEGK